MIEQIVYMNPTNIDKITDERIKSYFSVLYCEIIHPTTKKFIQRTGILSKTHSIIGASNLLPFKAVNGTLENQWREIRSETDEIIKRVAFVPIEERNIIMQNLISALDVFEKITNNVIDSEDEVTGAWLPTAEKISINVSGEPQGLKRVKGLVIDVMNKWKIFFELERRKQQLGLPQQEAPGDAVIPNSQEDTVKNISGLFNTMAKKEFGENEDGNLRLALKIASYLSKKRGVKQIMALAFKLYNFKIIRNGYNKKEEYTIILDKPTKFTDWQRRFYAAINMDLPHNFEKNYKESKIKNYTKELNEVRIALEFPLEII